MSSLVGCRTSIYVIFCKEQLITDPQDLYKPIMCVYMVRRQNVVMVENEVWEWRGLLIFLVVLKKIVH